MCHPSASWLRRGIIVCSVYDHLSSCVCFFLDPLFMCRWFTILNASRRLVVRRCQWLWFGWNSRKLVIICGNIFVRTQCSTFAEIKVNHLRSKFAFLLSSKKQVQLIDEHTNKEHHRHSWHTLHRTHVLAPRRTEPQTSEIGNCTMSTIKINDASVRIGKMYEFVSSYKYVKLACDGSLCVTETNIHTTIRARKIRWWTSAKNVSYSTTRRLISECACVCLCCISGRANGIFIHQHSFCLEACTLKT